MLAYLGSVAGASAGIVQCQDLRGNVAFEAGCDHGHCSEGVEPVASHEHLDDAACTCDECLCEDTPLQADMATASKRGVVIPDVMPAALHLPSLECQPARARSATVPARLECAPPFDGVLRALSTVILRI